ncbi:hypothetical protein KIL84_005224 [Mauremys mutica]|uniref:Uncharacterized protein n=1 Tax=Mauremys mutica TaxID=74926 RepID=A0A9D4B4U3_9SAUR|nr:hypothetical protein KIL84_005224 [Mauremys mutica]
MPLAEARGLWLSGVCLNPRVSGSGAPWPCTLCRLGINPSQTSLRGRSSAPTYTVSLAPGLALPLNLPLGRHCQLSPSDTSSTCNYGDRNPASLLHGCSHVRALRHLTNTNWLSNPAGSLGRRYGLLPKGGLRHWEASESC